MKTLFNADAFRKLLAENDLLLDFLTMLDEGYKKRNEPYIRFGKIKRKMERLELWPAGTSESDLTDVLRGLQSVGAGRYIQGSNKRFVFSVKMKDLATMGLQSADNIVSDEEKVTAVREIEVGDLSSDGNLNYDDDLGIHWVNHIYQLRLDFRLEVKLPYDLSGYTSRRLGDFVSAAALIVTDEDTALDESAEKTLQHTFYIDEETPITLLLPADLADNEAYRLRSFFESLERDDEPGDW